MPDKPQASIGAISALPDHALIELSGVNAIAFAQAQFMNDVAALGDDEWQWNGWLTPKGRVVALFALARLDEQTLWLVLPDNDPEDLAARLRRFVFRSKVTIVVRDDLRVTGAFARPALASGKRLSRDLHDGVELDMSAEGGARYLRITPGTLPGDDRFVARWMAADLAHGLPRLRLSQQEQWTPQQLSLDRLTAFSVKKGCYPGQEIVARTHFLGKAKRGLIRVDSPSAIAIGADVRAGETVLGPVVCSADDGQHHVALAVVPLERQHTDALAVDTIAVTETTLLAGLAR